MNELDDQIEIFCLKLEKVINNNYILKHFKNADIIKMIQGIDNILYRDGISSFISTMDHNKDQLSDITNIKLKPLLDEWMLKIESNVDQQVFYDFLNSLQDFSKTYPDLFSDKGAHISTLSFYLTMIWDPNFKKHEMRLQEYIHRLKEILEIKTNKYKLLIETQYGLIDPYEFEELIAELFIKMGYSVEVTKKSGDFGVDVIAKKDNDIVAIQAKKYSLGNNIGNRDIQRLIGSMSYKEYKANKGILITTSDFTIQAQEQAKENPVELWNLEYLNQMISKYFINTPR